MEDAILLEFLNHKLSVFLLVPKYLLEQVEHQQVGRDSHLLREPHLLGRLELMHLLCLHTKMHAPLYQL